MSTHNLGLGRILVAGSPEVITAKPRRVLDERDIALLSDVSRRLMADSEANRMPDVMSFAFWCRAGHLKRKAEERNDLVDHLGRGLAFHIAPSNVPVNFAFSWAFALLAGNANVVRIPSRPFPQMKAICSVVDAAMEAAGDRRSAFVSYPSRGETTERLSALADVRIIWGGNGTVESVRALKSKPRCVDIAFADRFSLAVIDNQAVSGLRDRELAALAQGFYNDTYLMDQNACSSPMVVCWEGRGSGDSNAKARFWDAVRAEAVKRYMLQGSVITDKYVQLCRDAVSGRLSSHVAFDGLLQVVDIDARVLGSEALSGFRGKGGYFYQADGGFETVLPYIDETCQTVTYFGVDAEAIRRQVIESGCAGVDRIVPVGKAMDIDAIWDGMDLLAMASRKVDAR